MKKIFKHLGKNWIKYAFETLVVTMGILLAFALNTWNEDRRNEIRERELLIELNENLNSNILEFNDNIRNQRNIISSIDLILYHLENKKNYHDSLAFHFRRLLFLEQITISSSAYETLKSIGFNNIQSNSLRMKIIQLFEMTYPDASNLIRDVAMQRYPTTRSMFNKYFRTNQELAAVPTDYFALQENQEFLNWVYNRRAWKAGGVIGTNEDLIDPTNELIESVQEYLEN
jgi:hypothetical protein